MNTTHIGPVKDELRAQYIFVNETVIVAVKKLVTSACSNFQEHRIHAFVLSVTKRHS